MTSPVLRGISHVDHVGLTVPDLDQAVAFFVDVLGAEELYRSRRGPDPAFLPRHFGVAEDAALQLSMLRMPPNLNIELFQWSAAAQETRHPLPSDAGGHHIGFEVDDVDAAVAALELVDGVTVLGHVKQVSEDSPVVAGNRWTYLLTPWGLMIELVDRSRVVSPPRFVGPRDWRTTTPASAKEEPGVEQ